MSMSLCLRHCSGGHEPSVHAPQGYGSRFVCGVLSVTKLAATYLVCESNLWRYKIFYGVSNTWFVWIWQKMLCSPVLASSADS